MLRILVSENQRYLQREDGRPFFYLGDTAWELFHRLTREESDDYMRNRVSKRFTVIQVVALAEFDGLGIPNRYGHLPLIERDPARPNEPYWEHVDWVVARANSLGLVVGFLPTWGKYVTDVWGENQVIFDAHNARVYGEFLGQRYRDADLIWILGGDRPAPGYEPVWRAMAEGLAAGDGGAHLRTYHPHGEHSSGMWLHDEPWLDFNMLQSGHARYSQANYAMLADDYARTPTKPCLDAEPCYEDHPVNWAPLNGWFDDYDVRKAAYWGLFAGACGHTYGCHDIWQFLSPLQSPVSAGRTPWREAQDLPGSYQMRHARALIESRPYFTRIPDQRLILSGATGATDHAQATRDGSIGGCDATYLMVYIPTIDRVVLDTSCFADETLRAWWYDPSHGVAEPAGESANTGRYVAQRRSSGRDWVLVLDAVKANYPAPGMPWSA